MRTVLLALLAAALCLHAAHSLKCYTCVTVEKNSECTTQTECPPISNKQCMTFVASASGKTSITKQCAPTCSPGKGDIGGVKGEISCCSTDLCNESGATSVKLSNLALLVPAGLVLSLLRAGL
ncbi:lymphocyte antigen 6E-like isoform X2 [Rhinatrema bivittatum]|uniref:lymphocyte antigen 6E-like isoform X2 n=1 Tax=Rhinatrema bivittatum TaxID=194408 RepID=UPI00112732D2|nr:lymphocyte antigen 6E-like isoform X2 [Rhinatrema bivittatum]